MAEGAARHNYRMQVTRDHGPQPRFNVYEMFRYHYPQLAERT